MKAELYDAVVSTRRFTCADNHVSCYAGDIGMIIGTTPGEDGLLLVIQFSHGLMHFHPAKLAERLVQVIEVEIINV